MWCKHEWSILNKEIVPSVAEHARDIGATGGTFGTNDFIQTYITTYVCSRCGKLKIDKTKTSGIYG